MIRSISLSFLVFAASTASAQEVKPEDVGFRAYPVASVEGPTEVYVSTEGRPADTSRTLPLVVYLQGSGYGPVYSGPPDRLSHVLMLKPTDFPGFHYAVVGKPDAPFWAAEAGSPTTDYHEALTLGRRVADASAVIEALTSQPWVDGSRVVVVGHSEGAQVAPALAAANGRVTHVAALAASGLSQAFDFVLNVRRRVRAGELSFEEGEARIAALHDQFRRIEAAPASADSLWRGHSYRRWSSFFEPPLAAFLSLDVPVFVGIGVYDVASPVESADYLPVAFLLAGKENLTYRAWPTDHRFQETLPDGARVDRRSEVVGALSEWLNS
ncbi:MAG: acetylxylan esterase [Bacteroidota bacterium]